MLEIILRKSLKISLLGEEDNVEFGNLSGNSQCPNAEADFFVDDLEIGRTDGEWPVKMNCFWLLMGLEWLLLKKEPQSLLIY